MTTNTITLTDEQLCALHDTLQLGEVRKTQEQAFKQAVEKIERADEEMHKKKTTNTEQRLYTPPYTCVAATTTNTRCGKKARGLLCAQHEETLAKEGKIALHTTPHKTSTK